MRAKALASALACACLLGAAAPFVWPGPAAGQEEGGGSDSGWIVSRIESMLSGPGRTVTIGRIVPSARLDVRIENLRIADDKGVWLTIERADVDWAPGALLRRELRISAIEISRMTLARLPESQQPQEPSGGFSLPTLPDLPVVLDLRRVAVERLDLGAPVLGGEPARLRIDGELRYAGAQEGLSANLDIRRTDEKAGTAALAFAYAPKEDRLALDLTVDEPAGGILARTLDIPGQPPVQASWKGSGPLGAWRSQLTATAGDAANLSAAATIDAAGSQGYAATVDAQGSIDGLFTDPATARLVGPSFSLDGKALIAPGQRIDVEDARIVAGPGTIGLSGSYDIAQDRLDVDYRVEAGQDSTLQALVPDGGWRSAQLAGAVTGPAAAPTIRAELEGEQVTVASTAADRLVLTATLAPAEPEPSGAAVYDIALDGDLGGLETPYPAASTLLGNTLSLSAKGAVVPGGGVIRLGNLDLSAAAIRVTGDGELSGWGSQGAGTLHAAVPELARLEPLTGLPVSGGGEIATGWTLAPGSLGIDGAVTFHDLDSPDAALVPVIADAVGRSPTVRLDGSVGFGNGHIAVSALQADLAAGTLTGSGSAEGWGADFEGAARMQVPEMARLAGLAGQPLTGAATLTARLDDGGEADILHARLEGELDEAGLGIPAADALIGPRTDLSADIVVTAAGDVLVQDAVIKGEPATVTADARWQGGRITARWNALVPELSVLAEPLGTKLAGDLRASGSVEGPPDALAVQAKAEGRDLLLAGTRLPTARLSANALNLPAAPRGHAALDASVEGAPVTVASDFDLGTPGRLVLDNLALGTGGETVKGRVEVALATGTATGRLAGRIGDLGTLSALAGQPLAGEAGLVVTLTAPGNAQSVAFEADARRLRLGPEGSATLAADTARLEGQVNDLLAKPRIDTRLNAEGLVAGGVETDTLIASAKGGLQDLRFEADALGRAEERKPGFGLSTAGTLSLGDQKRVRLERLIGNYGGEPVSLARPATITIGDRRYAVEDLLLRVRDARIAADLTVAPDALGGQARIEALPLDLLQKVDPSFAYQGRIDGELRLAGTPRDPRGDLSLAVNGFQAGAGPESGIGALNAALTGTWRQGRLGLDGRVSGVEGIDLDVRAGLPLVLDPDSLVPSVPASGAVDGRAVGQIRMGRLNDFLASTGDRVGGQLGIDLTLAGTMESPVVGGVARLADGSYENVQWGTRVTGIEAVLRGDGTLFVLDRLQGHTPGGGTISATGRLDLAAEGDDAIDIRLAADDARVAQVDLVTATVDSRLSLTGPWSLPRLAGTIGIDRAVIHLPQSMPPQVVKLDVVEVYDGKPIKPAAKEERAPPPAFAAALDIAVTAPNQIFVRGRGLDVEFGADLHIAGTTAEPRISGQLPLVRGNLSLLTKRFEFERAVVTFRGGSSIDPAIDLLATASAEDITAQIHVTGLASAPQLKLESTPPLPDDEILARLLFNEPVSRLSPFQAVALAQSVSDLVGFGGGGPGFLERLQQGLGIDRLEITGGDGTGGTASGTQIEAGRYVSRDVYVGVEQGVAGGTNGTRAVIELDLTDNIKARSKIGSTGESTLGLGFEWEY